MNILLIGNGIDLAHNLPTKYVQCLEFLDSFRIALNHTFDRDVNKFRDGRFGKTTLPDALVTYLCEVFTENSPPQCLCELPELLQDNFWLNYFLSIKDSIGKGWIDFELEISKVINALSDVLKSPSKVVSILTVIPELRKLNNKIGSTLKENNNSTDTTFIVRRLKDTLFRDLNRFIRCMELYFSLCLDVIKYKPRLKDIENIGAIHKLLSFNYTDTFERLYNTNRLETCYIHGKIDSIRPMADNNMVLGIEEDPESADGEINLEFIQFKKYYQRIHKGTDYNYSGWYTTNPDHPANLYIFGHSLDVTDKDVLEELIKKDGFMTHIFYPDRITQGRQITNLVKIIGYDELNKRTRGRNKTIDFIAQESVPTQGSDSST